MNTIDPNQLFSILNKYNLQSKKEAHIIIRI